MANNVCIFPPYPGHININTSLCSYLHICITFNENTESHYGVVREPEFKTRRSAHSQSQRCWIKVLYCTITPALFNINHYDGQKVLSHKGIIQKRWRNASKAKKVANWPTTTKNGRDVEVEMLRVRKSINRALQSSTTNNNNTTAENKLQKAMFI